MKGKNVKRLIAVALATAMTVTMFPAITPENTGVGRVKAASTVTNENLLKNPTFEEATPFTEHSEQNQNNKIGNWFYYQDSVKRKKGMHIQENGMRH